MLHEPWWSEISPLRFASVEMTIGASADIVISSGEACSGMEDRWETIKLIAPKGETTHYILRVASAPSKCVRCASLRSGGRRLAVRTAMEHPIDALPRTPFPASRDFPSRGNERIGGTGYCVTYDTDSQSRNAPCVPFRGRGPQSGERDRRRRHYKTLCHLKGKREI